MDTLINKFRSGHRQTRDISLFIVVPHGPLFEIFSSEKVDKSKKRHSRSTCNSPHRAGNDVDLESLEQRLNNTTGLEKSFSYLYSNEVDSVSDSMENLDRLESVFKFKNYSTVKDQLPKDFLKNYSDKSFSCPLQDISISSGKFKARLPLTSFPCGHVCLKVRGFRLEIIHLLKQNQLNNYDNNFHKNNHEPICLNSILNDFTYQNTFSNFCKSFKHLQKEEPHKEAKGRRLKTFTTSHKINAQLNNNHTEKHITAQDHTKNFAILESDRVSAYNYLGSVSFPIFVEPCSLQFEVVGGWLVFSADTKQSIGMEGVSDDGVKGGI